MSSSDKMLRDALDKMHGRSLSAPPKPTSIQSDFDESSFRTWYGGMAEQYGLAPDPDDPKHFYDYRKAFTAGAVPDEQGHWPSEFKTKGHPRQIVRGMDTRTGERVFPETKYDDLINKAAEEHGVPYEIMYRLIHTESRFNPKAISPKGAQGIAQFMPTTAKDEGLKDPFDPAQAIPASAKYLKKQYDRFGDWKLAAAAYNAGPGNVEKYKGVPPFAETLDYVKKIFPDEDLEEADTAKVAEATTDPDKALRDALDKMFQKGQKIDPVKQPDPGDIEVAGVGSDRHFTNMAVFGTAPIPAVHPAMTARMSMMGLGPQPPGGFDELGRPLNAQGKPYILEGEKPKDEAKVASTRPHGIYANTEKENFIRRAADQVREFFGIEGENTLSEAARAQALIRIMAAESGMTLDQYRQSPEFIEKAASSFVNVASFGLLPAVRESLTGEVDFESTNMEGYVGSALGSLAGLVFTPVGTVKQTLNPVIKYLPQATQEGRLAGRILKAALHDAVILGPATGLTALGEAAKSITFSEAAEKIWDASVSGALSGAAFGLAKGMFPKDAPVDTVTRVITGLAALNAVRYMETGGNNPFTDRPIGEVIFDIGLDVLFSYKGLPKGRFAEFAKELDQRVKDRKDLDIKKKLMENAPPEEVAELIKQRVLEVEQERLKHKEQQFADEFNNDLIVIEEMGLQAELKAKLESRPVVESRPEMAEGKWTEEGKPERRSTKYVPASEEATRKNFPPSKEVDTVINRYRMEEQLWVDESGNHRIDNYKDAAKIARENGGTVLPTTEGKWAVALEPQRRVKYELDAVKSEPAKEGVPKKEATPSKEQLRVEGKKKGEVKPKVEVKKKKDDIPEFKTTQDAVAFGEKATPGQLAEIERRMGEVKDKVGELAKSEDFDAIAQEMSDLAYKAQLYREALEASEGKHPSQLQKEAQQTVKKINDLAEKEKPKEKKPVVVVRKKAEKPKAEEKPKEVEPESEVDEVISEDRLRMFDRIIEDVEAEAKRAEPKKTEPVTEVDRKTGSGPKVEESNGIFFQDKEKTDALANIFAERKKQVEADPEVYLQKLINDVNRWYHGENIDIKATREALSTLAGKASEMRDFFMAGVDHIQFVDVAREAAKWARNVGRPKAAVSGGTQLNMMIPVDKLPDMVRNAIKGIYRAQREAGTFKSIFRNLEIWKGTGYWYARDGKWRYELDPDKVMYDPGRRVWEAYEKSGVGVAKLPEVLQHPKLYELFPQLKDVNIEFNKSHRTDATHYAGKEGVPPRIVIKHIWNKSSLFHEVQHEINTITGAFQGGSTISEAIKENFKAVEKRIRDLSRFVTPDTRDKLEDLAADIRADMSRGKYPDNLPTWFNNEVANWLSSQGFNKAANVARFPFDKPDEFQMHLNYRQIPGEMESRLTERRMQMSPEARRRIPPWETLDEMLTNEGTLPIKPGVRIGPKGITREVFDYRVSNELYSGVPVDKAIGDLIAGARKVTAYMKEARGAKKFKPKEAANLVRTELNKAFIDRSGNLRRDLLDDLSDDGYEVVQKMYLAKGAYSKAASMLSQMQGEVYDGLSKHEGRVLDSLILSDRMIDIGKTRGPTEFNYPGGTTLNDFIAYSTAFPHIEKIDPIRAEVIRQRAAAYFEWMKKPLAEMLEAGLISKKEFDDLSKHNYRRIKLVDLFDKRYGSTIGGRKRTIYDSGVEALSRGKGTDIYEPSSQVMALEVFNRAYGRIYNNAANLAMVDIARNHPDNQFARIKEKRGNKIPSGWQRVFYYEGGTRKSFYLNPKYGSEWITRSPEISYKLAQIIRHASASSVLRTFATGIDWGFALANLPRDVMHAWFAAREFKNGKWQPTYSTFAPTFGGQMTIDMSTIFRDAVTRSGRYLDYINEGGGMEFLVHQGRLFQRGRHLEGNIDKIFNFMGFLGETSEIMTRLAIRERVIKNKAREQNISVEQARKDKKITQEATFAARDYMDFGQGGSISKAIDNGIPYLNASIQGTRGLFRSFKDGTKWESTAKLAQLCMLTTGVYLATMYNAPETFKELKGSDDSKNNLIIPLGDGSGFLDERGQMRYIYFKIPLDPGQKFFKTFFEGVADKMVGNEVDVDRITEALKEQSPVDLTQLPPSMSAAFGYMYNKDFWRNENIFRGANKAFGWPESAAEIDKDTPQIYRDLGEATGLSPERTRYALDQLFTKNSMWKALGGKAYDTAFSDLPQSQKEQHWAKLLAETSVIRRFVGVTNPYSKHASKIEEVEEAVAINRHIENSLFDIQVERFLYDKTATMQDVIKEASKHGDVDTYDRLIERFKWEAAIVKLPEKSFWKRLKGLNPEAKAEIFVHRLNKANEAEKEQLWKEFSIVAGAGDVVTDKFMDEVYKAMQRK